MLLKAVTFFLLFIAVIAIFGRLRFPRIGRGHRRLTDARCPACGRPRIGKGPCACGRA